MPLLPKPLIFSSVKTLKISIFPTVGEINIFQVFAKSMFLQISCISPSKIHPKTLPKRGPNDEKIDAENVLIFNIDFFEVLASIWEGLGPPRWSQVGPKKLRDLRTQPHKSLLKLKVF